MKSLSKIFVTMFALFLAVSSSYAQDYNSEASKYMVDGLEALNNNDYETAFNNFSKELEENPKSIPALCLISKCYMNLYGDFEEALRCANKAIEIAKNKKTDDYLRSGAYTARGNVYYTLGEFDKAIKDYTSAINHNPEEIERYISRAVCYMKQEKYDLFETECKKIITLDPENTKAYMYLGDLAVTNADYDKAIEYYSEVIEIDKNHVPVAYTRRGVCYFALGNNKQAASDIVEALDIDGNDEAFNFMLKMSTLCFDVVFNEFKSRYEEQPQNASWPFYIGIIYENVTQFKQALKYYEEAYEITPDPLVLEVIENVKKQIK